MRSQRFSTGTLHELDFEVFRGCGIARAIDVGANRGQSIVSIKSVAPDAEILALEPNVDLIGPLLRVSARFEGVRVIGVGCAADIAMRSLFTPVARGIVFDQWASLKPISPATALAQIKQSGFTWCRPQDVSVRTAPCLFVSLDAMIPSSGIATDLVKIDVEGAEAEVVEGAMDLITRDQPLLMAEGPNGPLIELLEGLGYHHYRSRLGPNSLFIHPNQDRGLDRRRLARLFDRSPLGKPLASPERAPSAVGTL